MARRTRSFGALIVLASCADASLLHLSYPEVGAHSSMVLEITAESGQQLIAIDLSVGTFAVRLPDTIEPDEGWEAHALLFQSDLEGLNLTAGRLTASPADEPYPIELSPDLVFAQSSADPEPNLWQVVGTPPPRLSPLRVKNDDPFGFCPTVELEQIELPGVESDVRFMNLLSTDVVLVGLVSRDLPGEPRTQDFFLVSLVGDRPVVEPLGAPASPLIRAVTTDAEGGIWGIPNGGRLHRLRVESSSVVLSPEGPEPPIPLAEPNWLHVDQDVVVMMGTDGRVLAANRNAPSGLGWREDVLYDFPMGLDVGLYNGALLARRNGEIWLGKGTTRSVVRLTHDRGVFAEPRIDNRLENAAAIGLSALGEVAGIGVLVGMTDGELHRYDELTDTWDTLGPTRFTQVLSCIQETEDGFLMAGGTGLFNYYVDPKGYCPLEARGYKGLRAPNTIRMMLPFGDGFVLGGNSTFGSTASLTWLRTN